MGKLLSILFATALSSTVISPTIAAEAYEEYEPLTAPLSHPTDKVEVIEFFWYGCPHCYDFDPHIEAWAAKKPANSVFTQIPAIFNAKWEPHARAFYAAQMLDLMGRFHHALFSAIHKQKRKIYTENAILDFVTELGMDEKAFKEAMHSFAVETKIRRSKQLVKASGIQGVPAVIVNGKYRTSGSLAGSYPRMIGIIDELVTEELALLPQPKL